MLINFHVLIQLRCVLIHFFVLYSFILVSVYNKLRMKRRDKKDDDYASDEDVSPKKASKSAQMKEKDKPGLNWYAVFIMLLFALPMAITGVLYVSVLWTLVCTNNLFRVIVKLIIPHIANGFRQSSICNICVYEKKSCQVFWCN